MRHKITWLIKLLLLSACSLGMLAACAQHAREGTLVPMDFGLAVVGFGTLALTFCSAPRALDCAMEVDDLEHLLKEHNPSAEEVRRIKNRIETLRADVWYFF